MGYAGSPTVRILPPTLRAFQAESPQVRVRLHDLSTEEMLAGLRDGKLQIALLVCPTPALLRGLGFAELTRLAICLAVSPKHPLARARSVTPAEVAKQPLIGFSRADYPDYHQLIESIFAPVKLKPRIAEEHDSVASLITAVEAGSGVAVGSSPNLFVSTAALGGTNAVNVRVFTGTFTAGQRFLPNGANSPLAGPILSTVVTNNPGGGIGTGFLIPVWQQGLDMSVNQGSTTRRNIPDVAAQADRP